MRQLTARHGLMAGMLIPLTLLLGYVMLAQVTYFLIRPWIDDEFIDRDDVIQLSVLWPLALIVGVLVFGQWLLARVGFLREG